MKNPNETRSWVLETSGRTTRSVLEFGSPLPLSFQAEGSTPHQSARGPAQSKTWRRALLPVCCCIILHSSFCLSAWGQSYSIDWHTIDGGGGTSTSGVYSVSGTIGQPDAGPTLTNGQYSVTGGFWALPVAVQVEGAPILSIKADAPGFARISWTPNTPGFVLQERADLSTGTWANTPSGATNPITVPATPPVKFYRLFKP